MQVLNVFEAPLEGFSLVEASAGTGKTYNITSLYIRAIIEKGYSPSNILVLTYTEAATAELKSRIRIRIKECIDCLSDTKQAEDDFLKELKKRSNPIFIQRLKETLFSFDEASIFTIHGFCQKLLREESLAFGVQSDFEIIQDTSELIQDSVDAFWRKIVKEYSDSKLGQGLLEFLMSEKITPEKLKPIIEKILGKPYANLLSEEGLKQKVQTKKESVQVLNEHLAYQWKEDKDALNKLIFSGKLNKRSYKPDAFKEIWKTLEIWINSSKIHFKGFDKLENFGKEKIDKSVTKGNEVHVPVLCELIDEFLAEISNLNMIKADFLLNAIVEINEDIEIQKEKNNALSFDDLLQKVAKNIDSKLAQKIAAQYPIGLVDEFQDTDPIQYSIFKQIYEAQDASLFMIGDPKQAIYSFRGADLFTYFDATSDVSDDQQYSLNNNYRANEQLISAVNAIFSKHKQPFVFDQPLFREAYFPEGKNQKKLFLSGEEQVPLSFIDCKSDTKNKNESKILVSEYVADQVKKLLVEDYSIGKNPVRPKDISILVRTKVEAAQIQNALDNKGIKSIARSNASVFKTLECSELKLILKAVIDHSNADLIRAALITSFIGYNSEEILALIHDESKWGKIVQLFRFADEQWNKYGVSEAFNELDNFFGIRERLSTLKNAERRITNLYHLEELLADHENKHKTSSNSIIRFLNQKILSSSTPSDEELIRLESDLDLVTITTLHSSKGLEYPIVFVPFLWDDFERRNNQGYSMLEFHDSDNKLQIDVAPKGDDLGHAIARNEALADALRLSYVALTRAEAACYIPFVNYKSITNSPLLALICGPKTVLDNKRKLENQLNLFYSELRSLDNAKSICVVESSEILKRVCPRKQTGKQESLFSFNNYSAKKFTRHDKDQFSRIVSFSSLTSSKETKSVVKDYDELEFADGTELNEIEEIQTLSRFTFPRGSATGNLLHNIFEHVNFECTDSHQQIINDHFEASDLDQKWLPVLNRWVEESLDHPLNEEIHLSKLTSSNVLKELEFHFPVNQINTDKIISTIRKESSGENPNSSISGFMKGFIDLIFRHEGKYFILDYKSNHLGDMLEDYGFKSLKNKIISSSFDVQYHIYVLALKLYLEQRDGNFDFEKNFGGVFYFFLRGTDDTKPGSGVYFDKPSKQIIDELEKELGVALDG